MPHADYECTSCAEANGDPNITAFVIEDLPVDCKFCPRCGSNKGFTKIFTANIIGGKGRQLSKALDTSLAPMFDKQSKVTAGAQSFQKHADEAMEKAYEKATPAERARLPKTFTPHMAPAGQVFGSLANDAKRDTRECVAPMLARQVKPQWER